MSVELAPERNCAGIPELVSDWEAYLKAPDPQRKRELLTRLDELAAQHRWVPSDRLLRVIRAAKAE